MNICKDVPFLWAVGPLCWCVGSLFFNSQQVLCCSTWNNYLNKLKSSLSRDILEKHSDALIPVFPIQFVIMNAVLNSLAISLSWWLMFYNWTEYAWHANLNRFSGKVDQYKIFIFVRVRSCGGLLFTYSCALAWNLLELLLAITSREVVTKHEQGIQRIYDFNAPWYWGESKNIQTASYSLGVYRIAVLFTSEK